uniref:Nuclear pore complex protein Nup85 n=1 Tax=Rhodosorus marinus TaxID=101924 RepID=A0A7S0BJK5_9RHOD|mmetsp:Transcript_17919/g.25878  ORF Transcript_17919/g.25878 Transcript_17919/m.25878 type:complete len:598 (+) Transcript_17919:957-2750(+)
MYIKICKQAAVVNIERVATTLISEKRERKHACVSHSVDRTAWRPETEGLSFDEVEEQGLLNAVVSAMSASRRLIGSSGVGEDNSNSMNIVEEALKCRDVLVRIAAFEYIVAGQALTEPYSSEDMRLVKHAIAVLFMPDGRPAQRSKIRHILRDLWGRLIYSRETALSATAWWERQRMAADRDESRDHFEKLRAEYIVESDLLIQYLFIFTAKGCYPGASHKRKLASLLTIAQAKRIAGGDHDGVFSDLRRITGALELGVVDNWDQNRTAAYNAMLASSDLNGLEEREDNGHVQAQFLSGVSKLVRSARLREADAGALLWRRFFNQLSKGGRRWLFASTPGERHDEFLVKRLGNACDAQLSFIGNLLNSMAYMTQRANDDLGEACEMGLVHGYALALRYALEDISYESFSARRDLRATAMDIINECSLALEVSMKGVGFHEPNVNAHQNDASEDPDERQKFVTGCFLSVSEVCNALGILVHRAPLADEAEDRREGVLDSSQINTIASLFDKVLRNTRHTGVIDKASDALKTIASRLVRSSSPNLRELPPDWLASTLASAIRGDLYVLRRSAGTPFYILAVLGAERKKGNRYFLAETVR